jgi:hypothetical protein
MIPKCPPAVRAGIRNDKAVTQTFYFTRLKNRYKSVISHR